MNNETRSYHSPLRRERSRQTRQRILEAVARIFVSVPDDALSFEIIAAEAGVSRRTVFHHFASKDALLVAFWQWANDQIALQTWPEREEDLTAMPPDIFASFDRSEGIVRTAQTSASGREMRLHVNTARQAAFRHSMATAVAGADPRTAHAATAVVQVLFSANTWLALKDYWQMDGQDAGEAVAWAISAILAQLHGASAPKSPRGNADA